MKRKILSILLCLSMALSLLPGTALAAETGSFSDMPEESYWAYAALNAAVKNGLLQGNNGKLMPKGNLTRAQMAAILNRSFGAQTMADISRFTDVPSTAWYYADIAKAVQMGTFQGGLDNTMRPNDAISRQEAFTVLARAFKLTADDASALDAFADGNSVSAYAKLPLAAMVQAGYVGGADGKLLPMSPVTREQFAQVLYRMLCAYIREAGIYADDISGSVMVNTPDVTLKNMTISGDLILGEGVGDGDVTLNSVTVKGRLVVRGGGENSIHIVNRSSVGSVIIGKTGDGSVRLRTEDGCRVDVVYVDDSKDSVILEGSYNQVAVTTDTPLTLNNAAVTSLTVTAENAEVKAQGTTSVSVMQITETAVGAEMTVDSGAKVTKVESAAADVIIGGEGTVTKAEINGSNTAVNTSGTTVTAGEDASGVTQNGTEVKPGETTAQEPSGGNSSNSSGGSGGSGGSGSSV